MRERDEILNWVRGVSAILVLAAHLRSIVFADLADLDDSGPATKVFYLITGIHHEAVMVFFVLSGYFVGGAVLDSCAKGAFSWQRYAVARLTRLWVVLLPALLLTLLCDRIGMHLAPNGYAGVWHEVWLSGPSSEIPADFGVVAFFGNLLFLQTVSVPVFGTNGPLWSLAHEFWYYVMFPLLVVAVLKAKRGETAGALGYGLVVATLLVWLPRDLLMNGVIWIMGVAVAIVRARYGRPNPDRPFAMVWIIGFSLPLVASLVASKFLDRVYTDYLVGVAFAVWLLVLPSRQARWRLLEPFGNFLASCSYTLYVSHFPVLFFLGSVFMKGRQFHSLGEGIATYTLFFLVAVIVAVLFWWLFESRTEKVRSAVAGNR